MILICNVSVATQPLTFVEVTMIDVSTVLIKDTVEDEIADAVIRLFDIAVHLKMDLEWHIAKKVQYNAGREYKHNKSY